MSVTVVGKTITPDDRPSRRWDRVRGWVTTRTVRGTDEEIEGMIADLQRAAVSFSIDPEPDTPYATLTYELGHADDGSNPDDQAVDQWSLVGNDLEIDIWRHPKILAVIKTLTAANKAELRRKIEHALQHRLAPSKLGIDKIAKNPQQKSTIEAFYTSQLEGVDSLTVSQYVLRRTLIVPENTNLRPAQNNVGKVYATAKLKTTYNPPETILFTLPDGFWLKRTPSVEPTANNLWTLKQEWWHADEYDAFVYDLVT